MENPNIGKRFIRCGGGVIQAVKITRADYFSDNKNAVIWHGHAICPVSYEDKFLGLSSGPEAPPATWLPFTEKNYKKCLVIAKDYLQYQSDLEYMVELRKQLPSVAKTTGIQAQPETQDYLVSTYERVTTPVSGGAYQLSK